MTQKEYHRNFNEVSEAIEQFDILYLFNGYINSSEKKWMFTHTFLEHRDLSQRADKWIFVKFLVALLIFKLLFIFKSKNVINSKYILLDSPDTLYHSLQKVEESLDDVGYLFFPCFKFNRIRKLVQYNASKHIGQTFVNYSLFDIFRFGRFYFRNLRRIQLFLRAVSRGNAFDKSELFLLRLFFYLKYVVKKIEFCNNTIIVKYDLAPEHLALLLSRNGNKRYQTVCINHGAMWGYNDFYIYSSADYQLCVSEREKQIICKYGNKNYDNVFCIGSPLQSFEKFNIGLKTNNNVHGDRVLVLLTCINDADLALKQIKVLDYLLMMKVDLTLRFRPASKEKDKIALASYLNNNRIVVSEGNTLLEDLSCHETVVTFSIDTVPIIYSSKRKMFVVLPDNYDFEGLISSNFVVSENFKLLDGFINYPDAFSKSKSIDDYYIKNFGEYREPRVLANLKDVLEKISNRVFGK